MAVKRKREHLINCCAILKSEHFNFFRVSPKSVDCRLIFLQMLLRGLLNALKRRRPWFAEEKNALGTIFRLRVLQVCRRELAACAE